VHLRVAELELGDVAALVVGHGLPQQQAPSR
jgi:hypothetical protein